MRAAIAQGYQKGFHTIVDANVVTAITAMVLFAVATASVRGFALMLLIGTALSMLTAVLATRAILAVLAGLQLVRQPALHGRDRARGSRAGSRIDFMGKRRIWFAISGAVVVALARRDRVAGPQPRDRLQGRYADLVPHARSRRRSSRCAARRRRSVRPGAVIQGRGASTDGKYKNFQIRTESLTNAEQNELQQGLTNAVQATSFGAKNVSESFGRQIAKNALLAIVVSLLLIVAYISLRFQWKYSVGVLVALAHDVVITVGVYALTGREVSTATVAAVLTVLGYSIYDTIIVFDRVRENVPLMRRASFRVIGNVSMWEVLPRSLATTFITLLPVGALYVFGGDTLKDFAFALLVGIGSGAYSSIFLAAPLLAALKEREPEFQRRRDDLGALAGRLVGRRGARRGGRGGRGGATGSRRGRGDRGASRARLRSPRRPAPVFLQARAPSAATRITPPRTRPLASAARSRRSRSRGSGRSPSSRSTRTSSPPRSATGSASSATRCER